MTPAHTDPGARAVLTASRRLAVRTARATNLLLVTLTLLVSFLPPAAPVARAEESVSPAPGTASACNPRPPVLVAVSATGEGSAHVTITPGVGPVSQVRFNAQSGALVDLPGRAAGATGSFVVSPTAGGGQF